MKSLNFQVRHSYPASTSGIEVPVTIRTDADHAVTLTAKIDTGAEYCVFQSAYADELELHAPDGELMRLSTATGFLETHGHVVNLSCLGFQFESKVFFAVEEGLPRNVLGLLGWLDRLRFGLVHHNQELFLSTYDD